MSLQGWIQVAQLLAPVVGAVAAAFSAVSARAAVRAARTARDAASRSEISESRARRAELDVAIESAGASPWPVVLVVKNVDSTHSARRFRLDLPGLDPPGNETEDAEIIPGAFVRVTTMITGPQLEEGDFFPGTPDRLRHGDTVAHAAAVKGELDYLDDLEIKRWRYGVHITEMITASPDGPEYAYGAHLFGAPRMVEDVETEHRGILTRSRLAWQVLRGRRQVVGE